jgi:hypothetical protein
MNPGDFPAPGERPRIRPLPLRPGGSPDRGWPGNGFAELALAAERHGPAPGGQELLDGRRTASANGPVHSGQVALRGSVSREGAHA